MNKFDSIKTRTLSTGFSLTQYGDSFCVCGQVQPEDLEELKDWDLILNVRNPHEMETLEFNSEELCEKLGIEYQVIPIMRDGDLSKEALEQVHSLLSSGRSKKTVIHCAVGGRATLTLLAYLVLSKKCSLEDLPNLAQQLNFHSPQMLQRLQDRLVS